MRSVMKAMTTYALLCMFCVTKSGVTPYFGSDNERVKNSLSDQKESLLHGRSGWYNSFGRFGHHPILLKSTEVPGYQDPIPDVLLLLKNGLFHTSGYSTKDIFLEECNNVAELRRIEDQIDTQGYATKDIQDPHLYACLIKDWFRRLPMSAKMFSKDTLKLIVKTQQDAKKAHEENKQAAKEKQAAKYETLPKYAQYAQGLVADSVQTRFGLIEQSSYRNVLNSIDQPQRSIFLWLCDLVGEIATAHYKDTRITTSFFKLDLATSIAQTLYIHDQESRALDKDLPIVLFVEQCITKSMVF